MKLLREYIRELLTEAARGPTDLPEGFGIAIVEEGAGQIGVYYMDPAENQSTDTPEGLIQADKAPDDKGNPCRGTWIVMNAESDKGWGPMLYDVMMEYVSVVKGSSLSPDRAMVSKDAHRVWNYYANNRPNVKRRPLDFDRLPFLTPDDKADDCSAWAWDDDYRKSRLPPEIDDGFLPDGFIDDEADWKEDYLSSPLNYTYYTEGSPVLDALRAAGKLRIYK